MYIEKDDCPTGRICSIDFGLKRIGIAISDQLQKIASPFICLENKGWKTTKLTLLKINQEYNVKAFLIGWPLMLNGTEGRQCELVHNFCTKMFNDFQLPIIKWDERLSSKHTLTINQYNSKRKNIDALVATVLLQEFLSYQAYKLSE